MLDVDVPAWLSPAGLLPDGKGPALKERKGGVLEVTGQLGGGLQGPGKGPIAQHQAH